MLGKLTLQLRLHFDSTLRVRLPMALEEMAMLIPKTELLLLCR